MGINIFIFNKENALVGAGYCEASRRFADSSNLDRPNCHVGSMLLEELGVSTDERILWAAPPVQLRAVVPYNRAGARSRRLRSVLDLSPGQEVRLNPAHNCQGGDRSRSSVSTLANVHLSRLPAALPAPHLLPDHGAGVPGGVQTPGPGQGHRQGQPPA